MGKGGISIKDVSIKILGIGKGGCALVANMQTMPLPEVDYLGFDIAKGTIFPLPEQSRLKRKKRRKKQQKQIQRNTKVWINKKKLIRQLEGDLLILCADFTDQSAELGISMIAALIASCSFLKLSFLIPSLAFPKQLPHTSKAWMQKLDATFLLSHQQIQYHMEQEPSAPARLIARKLIEQGVRALYELMSVPTYINVDFADIVTTLQKQGKGFIGIGHGLGAEKVQQALDQALYRAFNQHPLRGAKHAIIHVCVGNDLCLEAIEELMQRIQKEAQSEMDVIFGMMVKDTMKDEITITVLASGYEEEKEHQRNSI